MNLNNNSYSNEQSDLTSQQENKSAKTYLDKDCEMNVIDENNTQQSILSEVKTITLLEEQLQVNRSKQKVGEVIIHKLVETHMVQVPIRQEKLIIERIGKNPEKLAEVVVNEEKVNGFTHKELENTASIHITKSSYLKPQTAQELLESIAHLTSSADRTKIRLEIVATCSEHQLEHQNICDRYQ